MGHSKSTVKVVTGTSVGATPVPQSTILYKATCKAGLWDATWECLARHVDDPQGSQHDCVLSLNHDGFHVCECGYQWPDYGDVATTPLPTESMGCAFTKPHKIEGCHEHTCDKHVGHITMADKSLEAQYHHCPACEAWWNHLVTGKEYKPVDKAAQWGLDFSKSCLSRNDVGVVTGRAKARLAAINAQKKVKGE